MKKFVLIIIIILSILAIFSTISAFKYKQQLQNSNIQIKDLQNTISEYKESQNVFSQESYSIDKKLEKCTSENFMTIGMNNCTNEGIEAWNKEILNYSIVLSSLQNRNVLLYSTWILFLLLFCDVHQNLFPSSSGYKYMESQARSATYRKSIRQ